MIQIVKERNARRGEELIIPLSRAMIRTSYALVSLIQDLASSRKTSFELDFIVIQELERREAYISHS